MTVISCGLLTSYSDTFCIIQVSLGSSFFFNENKIAEMSQILDCLHKYVPSQAMERFLPYLMGRKSHVVTTIVPVLLGGDQLTVTRAHGAQAIMTMQQNVLVALYQCLRIGIPGKH